MWWWPRERCRPFFGQQLFRTPAVPLPAVGGPFGTRKTDLPTAPAIGAQPAAGDSVRPRVVTRRKVRFKSRLLISTTASRHHVVLSRPTTCAGRYD
jgi:hypothetical protein